MPASMAEKNPEGMKSGVKGEKTEGTLLQGRVQAAPNYCVHFFSNFTDLSKAQVKSADMVSWSSGAH